MSPWQSGDTPQTGWGESRGDHLASGCGLNGDWQAQRRFANTLMPAAGFASSSSLHRFTVASIVLEELLRNKVAKLSPWGLGKAGWTLASPPDRADPSVSGWWFSTLVLFKVYQQVLSVRQGGKCFSVGVSSFNQLHHMLLVSKQKFLLCHFHVLCLLTYRSALVEIPWKGCEVWITLLRLC